MKPCVIAVDLGATNVRIALVSRDGEIVGKIKDKTPKYGKRGAVISEKISTMIRIMMAAHPLLRPVVKGIGVSSMGPLDYQRGGPLGSPNIPFHFVPLVEPLRKEFLVPVVLFNDANAGVLGEQQFGAGKKKKNLVYITISTGIGAGAIVDDKLLLGRSGNAAEVGHMIVDATYNLSCSCKKGVGHWEGYASGRNIPKFFRAWARAHQKSMKKLPLTAEDIFDRARSGEVAAFEFLDVLNRLNARAISNITVAYDPELITLGGSVMLHNAPLLITGIKKYVDRYLKIPEIRATSLGDDIGLLGAAAAMFDQ